MELSPKLACKAAILFCQEQAELFPIFARNQKAQRTGRPGQHVTVCFNQDLSFGVAEVYD
jgi:hypothetical protein